MSKLPRENCYRCEYGCINLTVDVDEGTTPFMMKCRRRPTPERPIDKSLLGIDGECIGTATSCFYPKSARPANLPAPEWEWYKPDAQETANLGDAERDHVEMGGLILRARTDREPLYHPEPKP